MTITAEEELRRYGFGLPVQTQLEPLQVLPGLADGNQAFRFHYPAVTPEAKELAPTGIATLISCSDDMALDDDAPLREQAALAALELLCHPHHSKTTATMQPGGFRT